MSSELICSPSGIACGALCAKVRMEASLYNTCDADNLLNISKTYVPTILKQYIATM